jgi:hypothetical protein
MNISNKPENTEDQVKDVEQTSHTEHPSSGTDDVIEKPDNSVKLTGFFSLFKVGGIGLIATLFFASLFLNLSFILQKETEFSAQSTTHWFLIFGLIFITIISLIISFWNYHVRSIYLKDGPALVPERWGLILSELIEVWKLQHTQSQSSLSSVQRYTEEQTKRSNDLLESFLTLQDALTLRDEEISRLKKGYDAKIFKRFLMRFVRVDRSLREMAAEFSDDNHKKNYKYLVRLMQDALEECGVEQFIPELGSDYRDAGPQIADDPTIIETDDTNKDFKIAEIGSVGYVIIGEGETEVVIPSRVSIFRAKPLLSPEDK